MSGHSKWATTKHKKAVVDARRGKLFAKLIRMVEVAARDGGGNPDANPTLTDAIARARSASMPSDTIERAIKRGTGETQGLRYEAFRYEGYAPGGVAVLVEILTDNRNRAAADVRRIFTRNGGAMGEAGSVAWMFTRKGIALIPADGISEDDLLMIATEAGADDVMREGSSWDVICPPETLGTLKSALEEAAVPIESAQLVMQPSSTVPVDEAHASRVIQLLEDLEDCDDVSEVYSNFDISEDVLARITS